jgi:hypothetical protein
MNAMRPWIFALLLIAAPAQAAPTCLDGNGATIRCGVPGAMPVGWQPSPQQMAQWQQHRQPGPDAHHIFLVVLGLAAFFALFALLPRFDGARDEDWKPGD